MGSFESNLNLDCFDVFEVLNFASKKRKRARKKALFKTESEIFNKE